MISVMNMWPGAWVIAMGGFAFSTAACGVTLTLPAAITASVVTQFDKITHRNIPI